MVWCLPRSAQLSLAVCLLYATASVTLSMLNKALLSSYEFEGYFTLLFCQLVLSLTFCVVSRDYCGNPLNIPKFETQLVVAAAPMGVTYVVNVGCGLLALQLVNVPMFFCLRRLVAPVVLIYEYLTMGKVADRGVQGSIAVIVLGAIIAGWDTLNDDVMGYSLTMLNNLLTAAGSVMQKQFSEKTKLSAIGIVYVQALVAAPLTGILVLATGEVDKILAFKHLHSSGFWLGFVVSCAMGLVLTFSSILSTTYNSPLATSVTGNGKDIATTAIGWLAFSGFKATFKSVGGILVSFLGAFLYSYVNLMKQLRAKPAPAASAGAAGAVAIAATSSPNGPLGGKSFSDADLSTVAIPGETGGSDGAAPFVHRHRIGDVEAGNGGGGAVMSIGTPSGAATGPVSYAEWQATGSVHYADQPSRISPRHPAER